MVLGVVWMIATSSARNIGVMVLVLVVIMLGPRITIVAQMSIVAEVVV